MRLPSPWRERMLDVDELNAVRVAPKLLASGRGYAG